jgi:hypothetical protein
MLDYPWYEVINSNDAFLQGDFVDSCPIVIPPKKIEAKSIKVEVNEYNVIILSQSCDLVYKKVKLVQVCPVCQFKEAEQRFKFLKDRHIKNNLREGKVPAYHLLNKCEIKSFERDFIIVDFRSVYGVPFDFLSETLKTRGDRLRLLPPYREHLSQAFARFFMRVGLPVDIPAF